MPRPRKTAEAGQQLRASMIDHARTLVRREGAQALTMRALAAEAGCAVGLPYKVFASREELVAELARQELADFHAALREWTQQAGQRTVASNLDRFAGLLLDVDTPALLLAEAINDPELTLRVLHGVHATGVPGALDTAVAEYLRAEQRLGRVRTDVDVKAYGFLITGAIHNLLVSGEAYPRPHRRTLRRMLTAVARQLTTTP